MEGEKETPLGFTEGVNMAFNNTVEAFSLSHAMILDGETSFVDGLAVADEAWDIYGVNEASLEPDTDSYENEGDDAVQSVWSWLNSADLSVQAGYLSFPLISSMTGQPLEVVAGTESVKGSVEVDLWHEDSMNVPPRPALLRMPARDKNGVPADLIIGLYKVQFGPMGFDGPAYKDGLKVNYEGKATYSSVDELGVAFADGKRRVGRLIAIQR